LIDLKVVLVKNQKYCTIFRSATVKEVLLLFTFHS